MENGGGFFASFRSQVTYVQKKRRKSRRRYRQKGKEERKSRRRRVVVINKTGILLRWDGGEMEGFE